ncbi:gamma-glutamyltransferase family protein [Intrasporangium calvum]|uniref:Gamma-glutamyltransferase family protein n=1 Tax=Intrasporangium calvum TaxID=53358 RepID=A0ABT5GKB6_9MICO|nr:gamma-glutamyltransferase [Intrasporangium calvum]MDC5698667.1 gamma-glutamyltransferase family protein [Intrasporangium calvum]
MTKVAVAAPSSAALEAGLAVVADGGNAVDAAVAASIAAMCTEPGIVSLMGGAYVNIWPADGSPVVIDGNVEMPGRGADASRFGQGIRLVATQYGGGITIGAGHGSVANSGAVQALSRAVEMHGQVPWSVAVEPSERICREGFAVGASSAFYLGIVRETLFGADPEAHAMVTGPDGHALRAGEVVKNSDLADILELLAAQGPSLFTSGAVGRVLVEEMERHGGLLTRDDLLAYEAVERQPTMRRLGDWTVALNPPPSVGGPMLAVMLHELAARGPAWSWTDIIDIQRQVLSYRLSVHDRSPDLLADGHALLEAVERHGLAGLPTSASTAHVSAADSDGTACSITMSSGYGAGVAIPGTGILLNNALGEPELNRRGLHALMPGTRLASNMAPTTARHDAGGCLAIGSPGADRITTALLQVLGPALLRGVDIEEAIEAPRLHVRFREDGEPAVEHERHPAIAAATEARGLARYEYPSRHMYFGGVGAAQLDGQELFAAADSRREGAVGVAS